MFSSFLTSTTHFYLYFFFHNLLSFKTDCKHDNFWRAVFRYSVKRGGQAAGLRASFKLWTKFTSQVLKCGKGNLEGLWCAFYSISLFLKYTLLINKRGCIKVTFISFSICPSETSEFQRPQTLSNMVGNQLENREFKTNFSGTHLVCKSGHTYLYWIFMSQKKDIVQLQVNV